MRGARYCTAFIFADVSRCTIAGKWRQKRKAGRNGLAFYYLRGWEEVPIQFRDGQTYVRISQSLANQGFFFGGVPFPGVCCGAAGFAPAEAPRSQ
jgi:hypothetical protein